MITKLKRDNGCMNEFKESTNFEKNSKINKRECN